MTRSTVERLTRHVAHAAGSFEQRLLGRVPRSVTVAAAGGCMTVCVHESLSPLERRVALDPRGARRVCALHEDLFADAVDGLVGEIRRRTGVALCGAIVRVDVATGSILKTFTTGPTIDLFLLGEGLPALGLTVDAHLHSERDSGFAPGIAGDHSPEPMCPRIHGPTVAAGIGAVRA
jgi:uncharacterized protein YbcI